MRRFVRIGSLSLTLLTAVGLAVMVWGRTAFDYAGPLAADTTVILPAGISLDGISRRLAVAGVVDRPWVFAWGVRFAGQSRSLPAGEYAFAAHVSARGAMDVLLRGETVVRRLTIPEGLTSVQVLALVAAAEGLDGDVTADLAEGAVLPETYHFAYGDSRAGILARMTADREALLAELWEGRAEGLPLADPTEALILASIVEKETGVAAERPHIAGVFVNRMRRGMRLQSDPTVVYGMTGGKGALDRPLTRADIDTDNPYNTYRRKGLPPTPIANPGRAAIEAVLHPLETKDLYFVADGSGGHAFARTLAEHGRNVARWRKVKANRAAE